MKDFYNEKKDAIGICKVCNKGLSKESLVELENGIVCKEGNCDEELRKRNEIVNFNSRSIKKYKDGKASFIGALFLMLMGLGFVVTGIYEYFEYCRVDYLTLFIGSIFIGLSIYNYIYSKSLIKESNKNKYLCKKKIVHT